MDRELHERIRLQARRQDDVLTVGQCVRLGLSDDRVGRRVAEGTWQRLHPGVIVVHSGPVPWRSRARAALLYAGAGAVLSHRAAGHVLEIVERPPLTIEVSIPAHRRVRSQDGVVIRRRRRLRAEIVSRLAITESASTVVDLLGVARSDDEAVGWLCSAVRVGIWPEHVLEALAARGRARRRALTHELLDEVAAGVESPLELRYRRDVERPHGLPHARRQRRQQVDGRWIRADVEYLGLGVRCELDGRLAHPGGRTDRDTWRDNAVLIEHGDLTLRYRWRHVRVSPCATAFQVSQALQSRGWTGSPRACGAACALLGPARGR